MISNNRLDVNNEDKNDKLMSVAYVYVNKEIICILSFRLSNYNWFSIYIYWLPKNWKVKIIMNTVFAGCSIPCTLA